MESGHKEFDRQCTCVSRGNVISDCQYSMYIRPFTETECNGKINEKGHLQAWDLDIFRLLPQDFREKVEVFSQSESVILYQFGHQGRKRYVIDCYIVTTSNYEDPKTLAVLVVGPTRASYKIRCEVEKYISNGEVALIERVKKWQSST